MATSKKKADSAGLTLTVSEAKLAFGDLLARVAYGGQRVTLTKHGKVVAMIVPADTAKAA